MERQRLSDDLMVTAERAFTAVVSRGWDSATSEGLRVPPARDTGTGVVGLAVLRAWAVVMAAAEAMDEEDAKEETSAVGGSIVLGI